jgi:hypothetical protein
VTPTSRTTTPQATLGSFLPPSIIPSSMAHIGSTVKVSVRDSFNLTNLSRSFTCVKRSDSSRTSSSEPLPHLRLTLEFTPRSIIYNCLPSQQSSSGGYSWLVEGETVYIGSDHSATLPITLIYDFSLALNSFPTILHLHLYTSHRKSTL